MQAICKIAQHSTYSHADSSKSMRQYHLSFKQLLPGLILMQVTATGAWGASGDWGGPGEWSLWVGIQYRVHPVPWGPVLPLHCAGGQEKSAPSDRGTHPGFTASPNSVPKVRRYWCNYCSCKVVTVPCPVHTHGCFCWRFWKQIPARPYTLPLFPDTIHRLR